MPKRKSLDDFIKQAEVIHDNIYDYTESIYINNKTLLNISCPTHGVFAKRPDDHLRGQGCPDCIKYKKGKWNLKTTSDFKRDAEIVHGNVYDYSKVEYVNGRCDVYIICSTHGEFQQSPENHLSGKGCPKCNESKGERYIRQWLIDSSIVFNSQHKFFDCVYKKVLVFDFFIPSQNLLIEFDGIQHFEPVKYFGGNEYFKDIQLRDNVKNEYVGNSGMLELLRIPYMDIEHIDEILSENLLTM